MIDIIKARCMDNKRLYVLRTYRIEMDLDGRTLTRLRQVILEEANSIAKYSLGDANDYIKAASILSNLLSDAEMPLQICHGSVGATTPEQAKSNFSSTEAHGGTLG